MRAKPAVLLVSALALAGAQAGQASPRDGGRATRSCREVNVHLDGGPSARDEQTLSVPAAEAQPLRLRPDVNGGVMVWGGPGPDYAITVCRVASGSTRAEAAALLGSIEARAASGELTVSGPRSGRWTAFLLVSAPRGARLDVETRNGPLSFDHLDGSVLARTSNGPVSLGDVSGSVEVTAENGPISVENGSGDYTLRADNGPLSVELSAPHWDGRLEGRTQNGPLSVELPQGFASGLRLQTSSWAPASCRASVCQGARWEKSGGTRVLEVGAGQASVSLSTVNGPLRVSDSGS